jgi:hypothetical protein
VSATNSPAARTIRMSIFIISISPKTSRDSRRDRRPNNEIIICI